MKEIEMIKNEIEQRENSIKEMEEKLKEAKKELKKFEKYRGLQYELYKQYGDGKFAYGLAEGKIMAALRTLVLTIVGSETKEYDYGCRIGCEIRQVKELNCQEIKICNDILGEIYPIIAKYMDIVLDDTRTPQNDEVRE